MLLLGFDTATAGSTVAVVDGDRVLAEAQQVDARRHGEWLAPAISEALTTAGVTPRDLDAIAVGVGPGPFTGLRVGVVTARVLAATLGIPGYGVCTLDTLAAAVAADPATDVGTGPYAVATDARRREVYWARYEAGIRTHGPDVARPDAIASAELADLPVAGQGPDLYPDAFPRAIAPHWPRAADLCRLTAQRLAAGGTFEPLEPMYLRRPDAMENVPRKPVSAG